MGSIWGWMFSFFNCEPCCIILNPLSPNPTKTHSNNSSGNCQGIVWVCLTILWNWRLKGLICTYVKFALCALLATYATSNDFIYILILNRYIYIYIINIIYIIYIISISISISICLHKHIYYFRRPYQTVLLYFYKY